ncbi:MAG: hypothetical protein HOJ35_08275 [Bdellovibrionales bacterium]|nr:hypothetical protein [Bdellovibrionales bacterium]
MKKILVLVCLISSMTVSAETIRTDNPNRYLKNYICNKANGWASFNAVNKTNTIWRAIKFIIYDSDDDPVDAVVWELYVNPQEGREIFIDVWNLNSCKKLTGAKYHAQTLPFAQR